MVLTAVAAVATNRGMIMGLLKAIVGGTIGLAVGVITCAPLTGMVGGAFIAQDWD